MKIVRGHTGASEMRTAYATGTSWADPVLGGEHAQSAMHFIGHISDGDRGHDIRRSEVLGVIAS